MLKKRKYQIFIMILLLVAALILGRQVFKNEKTRQASNFEKQDKKETVKIGFFTDAHCYSKQYEEETGDEWILNWRCAQPLEAFVNEMNNNYHPDVVIDGGDLVDGRDDRRLDTFLDSLEYFKKLKAPYFMVLGNHEVREFTKEEWLQILDYEKAYYFLDVKDLRIFILDGNYYLEGNQELAATPDNEYNPGRINQEQLDWLKNNLEKSKDKRKMIFIHQPPIDSTTIRESDELLDNAKELRGVIAQHEDVLAVVSGHIEEFCTLEYDGIPYYVLQGAWKENKRLPKEHQFEEEGMFYEIEVREDEVEITALSHLRDAEELKTFKVNKETSICNNDSVLENEK